MTKRDRQALGAEDTDALFRWRLALGPEAEKLGEELSLAELREGGDTLGLGGEAGELDEALSFVYGDQKGGPARVRPYVPRWLGALREFFREDVVALVQRDAIERKGLTELLFEPETLPYLEKNVELVATLVSAKGLIPDRARELARALVRDVVEELRRKLEAAVRTAILGAVRRSSASPLAIARNIDWQKTIRKNLKGWDAERRRLIAERFYFFANQRKRHEWDVVLAVDQSASMAESVVYSSVMAAIFASIDVLKTKLIFFDTEIADVTPMLVDPVELLFSAQLGGGTDINRAMAYAAEHLIDRPEKTIFVLVSDLFEGGNPDELVMRARALVEAKVKLLCLLALTDRGRPSYDHELARQLGEVGVHCFGCTPALLAEAIEYAIKGQDLTPLLERARR